MSQLDFSDLRKFRDFYLELGREINYNKKHLETTNWDDLFLAYKTAKNKNDKDMLFKEIEDQIKGLTNQQMEKISKNITDNLFFKIFPERITGDFIVSINAIINEVAIGQCFYNIFSIPVCEIIREITLTSLFGSFSMPDNQTTKRYRDCDVETFLNVVSLRIVKCALNHIFTMSLPEESYLNIKKIKKQLSRKIDETTTLMEYINKNFIDNLVSEKSMSGKINIIHDEVSGTEPETESDDSVIVDAPYINTENIDIEGEFTEPPKKSFLSKCIGASCRILSTPFTRKYKYNSTAEESGGRKTRKTRKMRKIRKRIIRKQKISKRKLYKRKISKQKISKQKTYKRK